MSFYALLSSVVGIVLFLAREEASEVIALILHRINNLRK